MTASLAGPTGFVERISYATLAILSLIFLALSTFLVSNCCF